MQSRIATTIVSLAMAGAALAQPALAAEPIGSCGDRLWGIVAWEKKPNVDKNNPDASKRSRPTLGIPILLGMAKAKANPNRWDGEIYNSEDGRTYTAHISLAGDDVLQVEGCVLGFLCGSQNWTRVVDAAPPAASPRANAPRPAAPAPRRTTGQAAAAAPPPASDVCTAVATATGQPIEQVTQTGKRSER
jgi:uncharacterized protein (DUF2147 family)